MVCDDMCEVGPDRLELSTQILVWGLVSRGIYLV